RRHTRWPRDWSSDVCSSDLGQARKIHARHDKIRCVREIAREQRLLNVARNVDLLFEALALAFAFDEARVVQNSRGVRGERIQDRSEERRVGKECRSRWRSSH